ncbi:ketosteroid isomerase [Pedobacter sp. AW1-32]|uniref:nuclear transport factor 2 family protein n=1 Tax=Pedobacter sp. AW1-32 TaxID=3383026 RepID=UPI003FEF1F50
MESKYWPAITTAYAGFNAREIDTVFSVMNRNIHWPKAFEGGYVIGLDAVRAYWTKQWSEINPKVTPVALNERTDGKIEILIDQLVKDLDGNILFDGQTKHVYIFENDRISRMDIENI